MKASKFAEAQKAFIIKQGEEGTLVAEICRKAGIYRNDEALAIYLFFQFIQAPVAHVFNIFDGHRQLLFLNVQRVALIAAVFGLSHGLSWTSEFAVWAYALTLSLHYALSAVYAYRFIPIRSRGR
jgi:hypothetical protein